MRIAHIALGAAALAAPVWAEHPVGPEDTAGKVPQISEPLLARPFPPFSDLDRDGDGRLGPEEVAAVERLNRQFGAADVDQNGTLSESEFSAFETIEGVMPGPDVLQD